MRRLFFMFICGSAGLSGLEPAFSQDKIFPDNLNATAPKAQPADSSSKPGSQPGTPSRKGSPAFAQVGRGTAQDYQKDNPLLKTDLNKVSEYQGKMFATKEINPKQFGAGGKDQPIVLNKMFVQNSTLTGQKNDWQNKDLSAQKKSDLTGQQSTFIDKKANLGGGGDVPLKMVTGFDAKAQDAKKAAQFSQMLSDGQKRYLGPESPDSPSEMELIQDHLKQANGSEELKKNQLTTDEVKKLLQPNVGLTRPE